MIKLIRSSRNRWLSEDKSVEVLAKETGRKIRDGRFTGSWHFSPKHADMMPHQPIFSIFINGERKADEIYEDEISPTLRRLGYLT